MSTQKPVFQGAQMDNEDEIVTSKINKKRKLNVIDSDEEEGEGQKVHKVAVVKKVPEGESLENHKHKNSPLKESVSKANSKANNNTEGSSKAHQAAGNKKSPGKAATSLNSAKDKQASNGKAVSKDSGKKDASVISSKKQEASAKKSGKGASIKDEPEKKASKNADAYSLDGSDASMFEADTLSSSSASSEEKPKKAAVQKGSGEKAKKAGSGFIADKLKELKKNKSQEQNKAKAKKGNEVKREEVKNPVQDAKKRLISDVLKRWWYCMPDWPPAGLDYRKLLRENDLELSDEKTIKIEQGEERNGSLRVYAIDGFEGLFKDKKGNVYDLRPRESCPCYENLKKKSTQELKKMLVSALQKQIEALEKFEHKEEKELTDLRNELKHAQKSL